MKAVSFMGRMKRPAYLSKKLVFYNPQYFVHTRMAYSFFRIFLESSNSIIRQ
jgi:hypothetical protein